jgi:hypothetical protein
MANLVNPATGRTFVHEAVLGTLMEWTTQKRILKAMWLSRRVEAHPRSLALLAHAVKATVDDKTGKVGLTEEETIKSCLVFLQDPKVVRIIARTVTKLHGVPFREALRDLRGWREELHEMVRPGPIIVH